MKIKFERYTSCYRPERTRGYAIIVDGHEVGAIRKIGTKYNMCSFGPSVWVSDRISRSGGELRRLSLKLAKVICREHIERLNSILPGWLDHPSAKWNIREAKEES